MKLRQFLSFFNPIRHKLAQIPNTFSLLVKLIRKSHAKKAGITGKISRQPVPEKQEGWDRIPDAKVLKGFSSRKILATIFLFLALIGVTSALLWQKLTHVAGYYASEDLSSIKDKHSSLTDQEANPPTADSIKSKEASTVEEQSHQSSSKEYSYSSFLPAPTVSVPLSKPPSGKVESAPGESPKATDREYQAKSTLDQSSGHKLSAQLKETSKESGERKLSAVLSVNGKQPYTIPSNTITDTINPQFLLENPVTSQQQVAIIVSGLGINEEKSDDIIDQLPEKITLAISPYTPNVANFIEILKIQGFDVLMSMFLEGYSSYVDLGRLTLRRKSTQDQKVALLNEYIKLSKGCSGFYAEDGQKFLKSYSDVAELLAHISKHNELIIAPPDVLMNQFHLAAANTQTNYAGVTLLGANLEYSSEFISLVKRTGYGIIAFDTNVEGVVDKINQWIKILSDNKIEVVPVSVLLRKPENAIKSDK